MSQDGGKCWTRRSRSSRNLMSSMQSATWPAVPPLVEALTSTAHFFGIPIRTSPRFTSRTHCSPRPLDPWKTRTAPFTCLGSTMDVAAAEQSLTSWGGDAIWERRSVSAWSSPTPMGAVADAMEASSRARQAAGQGANTIVCLRGLLSCAPHTPRKMLAAASKTHNTSTFVMCVTIVRTSTRHFASKFASK
jgi:hypothetical protein